MITLAIDPSINETGWALGRDGAVLSSGVIRTRGNTHAEKLHDLHIEILDVLDQGAGMGKDDEHPGVDCFIEVPAAFTYGRSARGGKALNAASMMLLSRAIGVLQLACMQETGHVREVLASWKGQSGKKQAQVITKKTNHNEADAVLLCYYCMGRLTW